MSTVTEIRSMIETKGIQFVDFKVVDLFGRWHHLTIPAHRLTEKLLIEGVGFDGSSYGYLSVNRSDMLFRPDLSTAVIDPFYEHATLSMIGEIYEAGDQVVRYGQDPRYIAQKTEQLIAQSGIADAVHLGPEFEFYVFDEVRYGTDLRQSFYEIDSQEGFWNNSRAGGDGYIAPQKGGYHLLPPHDRLADLRNEVTEYLESVGVGVKYHHHEVGGPGQLEIETMFGGLLEMADNSLLIKHAIRNIAVRRGLTATFMPKPLYGEAGNGFHVHQFLTKEGHNVFNDETGYQGLSQNALYYIGGILKHAPSLCGFANASTNSYKRLVPGYEAPVSCVFAAANRSAAIRIPTYIRDPQVRRMEYRPMDATCNPYLAFSAMVMAGIDGILNRVDPTVAGFGPFEGNLYDLSPLDKGRIKHLPTSLDEALRALEQDHEYLLRGGVFPKELIDTWVKLKRDKEIAPINRMPHPYEFALYYDL
ncbi:MAG: type I glutamate--ammonia ligase [Bacillota bacterium]